MRPMNSVGLRGALLVGVSLGALSIGLGGMSSADAADMKAPAAARVRLKAPPLPPPPTWFFSAEGGAACAGDIAVRAPQSPGGELAHVGGCGWTARLGFGQENTAVFGRMADYWGVFVRYTRIQDNSPVNGAFPALFPTCCTDIYNFTANSQFDERRTIIDFEAGRDIGIGDGAKLRGLAGLRFAHYSTDMNVLGLANGYTADFFTNQKFDGLGPRAGFSYRRPLVGLVELTAEGSAAVLWGRFKTTVNDSLTASNAYSVSGSESHNGWVGNLEGSIALAYAPYGPRGWDVALGVRAEDWFRQVDTNLTASTAKNGVFVAPLSFSQREDRFNWGPFLRVKVPLGN
jgi:Legionella pneumophila major outer membrane protein precursor